LLFFIQQPDVLQCYTERGFAEIGFIPSRLVFIGGRLA
jgi:hypothetical protein